MASTAQPVSLGAVGDDAVLVHILASLEDAKAENVVSIDLRGKTALADAMVIATGRSNTHVGSIAERVVKACKAEGVAAPRVEGVPNNDWVLVDTGDIIVHIFRPEVRLFYNLEKMWTGDRPGGDRLGDRAGDKAPECAFKPVAETFS